MLASVSIPTLQCSVYLADHSVSYVKSADNESTKKIRQTNRNEQEKAESDLRGSGAAFLRSGVRCDLDERYRGCCRNHEGRHLSFRTGRKERTPLRSNEL